MARPEDSVEWVGEQPYRCYFYPGRDCPGCELACARIGRDLPGDARGGEAE